MSVLTRVSSHSITTDESFKQKNTDIKVLTDKPKLKLDRSTSSFLIAAKK